MVEAIPDFTEDRRLREMINQIIPETLVKLKVRDIFLNRQV